MKGKQNEVRDTVSEAKAQELRRRLTLPVDEASVEAAALSDLHTAAPTSMVNRTRRTVRARARTLQARRSRIRSLWLPLLICSGLLVVICTAIWSVLDEYELVPTGMPDASQQMFVLLMWCLPLSAVLIALVWSRNKGLKTEGGGAQ